MNELQLPPELQIAISEGDEPEALFLLTVGILGDAAAIVANGNELDREATEGVEFSASFFDAFLSSGFRNGISRDVQLLASASYYIARRPGSSHVLARELVPQEAEPQTESLLRKALNGDWSDEAWPRHPIYGDWLQEIRRVVSQHFLDGTGAARLNEVLVWLRQLAYNAGTSKDLLLIDLVAAITIGRLRSSTWTNLPLFSNLPLEAWTAVIHRPRFPKELWPAQMLLGSLGFFAGRSGVIQMPTSAGKTRSVEIALRSAFLSGRTRLAVIVAPFRALCHEIADGFRQSFADEDVKINELTDVLQMDFLDSLAELFGTPGATTQSILVLTPEKFLYILRQSSTLVNDIGVIVYDEGHQFDSGARGVLYELLLTEIKNLLPGTAQTILVSAVIRNALAVSTWLVGATGQIADGSTLLPTKRSIAFASWIENLGQLYFFENRDFRNYDYFVPRIIEERVLGRLPGERSERSFPNRAPNDIALYLGIRLVPKGAVAIFCGLKATASGIAKRAVEIYQRLYTAPPPSDFSDPNETRALQYLIERNFGGDSVLAKAARLGVFVHHGNTPQGIRLCVEHAMQANLIKFVVCTSTLAQGVNLPIRYLIVSGTHQGGEKIKVRDFQNLIGRAGRAGMHTEGLVIFADPLLYDRRGSKFQESVNLLSPERSEETSSSILEVLKPFAGRGGASLVLPRPELADLLLSGDQAWETWASETAAIDDRFEKDVLISNIRSRRKLLATVESYLMANRGDQPFDTYRASIATLATATLAFHLAPPDVKDGLVELFTRLADFIERTAPAPLSQANYAKTLLPLQAAQQVETWVQERRAELLLPLTNREWLNTIWPLLVSQVPDKFFHAIEPEGFSLDLASAWLDGESYSQLFSMASQRRATKPYGRRRQALGEDDIIKFFESVIGFDCSLIIAATIQYLREGDPPLEGAADGLSRFQKALKYGLPTSLSVSAFEYGYADRELSQDLARSLAAFGYNGERFGTAARTLIPQIEATLVRYPAYFRNLPG